MLSMKLACNIENLQSWEQLTVGPYASGRGFPQGIRPVALVGRAYPVLTRTDAMLSLSSTT